MVRWIHTQLAGRLGRPSEQRDYLYKLLNFCNVQLEDAVAARTPGASFPAEARPPRLRASCARETQTRWDFAPKCDVICLVRTGFVQHLCRKPVENWRNFDLAPAVNSQSEYPMTRPGFSPPSPSPPACSSMLLFNSSLPTLSSMLMLISHPLAPSTLEHANSPSFRFQTLDHAHYHPLAPNALQRAHSAQNPRPHSCRVRRTQCCCFCAGPQQALGTVLPIMQLGTKWYMLYHLYRAIVPYNGGPYA